MNKHKLLLTEHDPITLMVDVSRINMLNKPRLQTGDYNACNTPSHPFSIIMFDPIAVIYGVISI